MKTRTTNNPEVTQALDQLARYLAIRDHSRLELQQKLAKKFEQSVVNEALAHAELKHWLQSEAEIAERAAEVFLRKGKSRSYIENQLQKRGLPVPPLDSGTEKASARKLVEKKFGPLEDLDFETKEQALRYLANRGFEENTIRTVLNAES